MSRSVVRQLIRCDGAVVDLPDPISLDDIGRLIGAVTLDTVLLRHMGLPLHVMWVDDNGYETETVEIPEGVWLKPVRARKPVNAKATELYLANCMPGTTHQIVGDVVVLPDEDYA